MTGFFTAPRIAWGTGAIEQLSGLGSRRALVAVDGELHRREAARRVVEELGKTETTVEVVPLSVDPDRTDRVLDLARAIGAFHPDWLVVAGGGRAIDAAKAARLLYERPELDLSALPPVLDGEPARRLGLAAVPSTSGSGGEASATIDLWSVEGTPFEYAHRSLTPDWALVDPRWGELLSPELVLDGAFETLGQALEAYLSAWANPFSDALAVDAIATVLERLPHALRWSDDPDARAALQYAATAAGLAASNAQRGVGHALARALVGPTGLSYGRLVGLVLPTVLDFDRPAARDRIEALATAVLRGENPTRLPIASRLTRLTETFRFPTSLRAAGYDPSKLGPRRSRVVEEVLRSPAALANPRVPSASEVAQLLDGVAGLGSP